MKDGGLVLMDSPVVLPIMPGVAAVVTILSQYVCGITPTEAGYKAYRIAPQPTGVKEAEILVPTVKGNIKVSFKR